MSTDIRRKSACDDAHGHHIKADVSIADRRIAAAIEANFWKRQENQASNLGMPSWKRVFSALLLRCFFQ
jgi:hypothetical protein